MSEQVSYVGMAEAAIGNSFFYDGARALQAYATPEQLAPTEIGQRRLFYTLALRGLAEQRHAARQQGVNVRQWQPAELEVHTLQDQFEPVARRLALINNLEDHIAAYKADSRRTGMHEYQKDALENVLNFMCSTTPELLHSPDRVTEALTKSGYMDLPTAYGKTYVMVELAKAFGIGLPATETSRRRLRSLVLVPRDLLVNQTLEEFNEFAPDIAATPFYGRKKDPTGDVVVMTYQTFNRLMAAGKMDEFGFDVVMCDEAHHGLGKQTSRNLEEYRRGKLAIGMTASPDYGNDKHVEQILPHLIHRTDMRTAIEADILSGVQCMSYLTGAEIVVKDYGSADFTEAELAELAENEARNHHATLFAQTFVERGMQGIIASIPGNKCQHARELAAQLRATKVVDAKTGEERSMRAEAVGDFLPKWKQDEILQDYADGKIDVLTFVKVIGEGWDCKNAKFLISTCPTASPVRAIQRFGRVMRHGQPAIVVEFLDIVKGGKKAQYTFMHVLGEDHFWQERTFGAINAAGSHPPVVPIAALPAELRARLAQLEAIPVDELIVMPRKLEAAPEGWISMPELATIANGMSAQYIRKLLLEHGFEGRIVRGNVNTPTFFFPPEAVTFLQENIVLDRPPKDWMMLGAMSKLLGISDSMTNRFIDELGLTGKRCRAPRTNMATTFYSPAEVNRLVNAVAGIQVASPDEHTWDSMAAEWNISKTAIFRKTKELGMVGTYKRTRERGPLAYYFTDAQYEALREAMDVKPLAPEGWRSIRAMAQAAGVGRSVVELYLEQERLWDQAVVARGQEGKKVSSPVPHWNPDIVQRVVQALKPQEVPSGWVAVYDYAQDRNIVAPHVRKIVQKLQLESRTFRPAGRVKSRPMDHIPPEAIAALDAYFGRTTI